MLEISEPGTASQITKVTANFKYQRHYTINRDVTQIKDSNIPAAGVLVGEVEIGPNAFKQQWLLPNGKIIERTGNKSATGTQPFAGQN